MFLQNRICLIIVFYFIICNSANSQNFQKHSQYTKLEKHLFKYREIESQNGWPLLSGFDTLKLGVRHKQVPVLRKRLHITGEYPGSNLESDSFDLTLCNAVKRFQVLHGLDSTGIVTGKTLKELNVPAKERIKQIEANMARWKLMGDSLENFHIFVNLAAYNLDVIEDNKSELQMKVVIGQFYRKTPVFSADLKYIEFNPSWYIPPNITKKDILPKVKDDPNYLDKHSINVFQNNSKVDPATVDWKNVNEENNPYKFIQFPGSKNPMGKIKFLFPNKYKVYMHDTPDKKLFDKPSPTLSSGCIRLSKANGLAKFILKKDKGWEAEKIDSLIEIKKTVKVELERPIKIYIQYFTAWVSDDGYLQFMPDIYKRD